MPLIALTGTPGTGKTAVAAALRARGHEVLDLAAVIADRGLREGYDAERDTYEVDTGALAEAVRDLVPADRAVFAEGHLSHLLDCEAVVVLRCRPDRLAERLRARGYDEGKVRENVQAEILDVILCEAVGSGAPVHELDCTDADAGSVAAAAAEAVGGGSPHPPGGTDWTEEAEAWF
jgi:adenylate kinase